MNYSNTLSDATVASPCDGEGLISLPTQPLAIPNDVQQGSVWVFG